MAFSREDLDALVNDLKQRRDTLRVKMHLAQADARDEWQNLEKRWEAFEETVESQMDKLEDAAEDAADNIEDALKRAGNDLKQGYERLRKKL